MNDPLALNPFKKGKKTEVEGVKKVEVEKDSELENILEIYNEIPTDRIPDYYEGVFTYLHLPALSPSKINLFLNHVLVNGMLKKARIEPENENDFTGAFVSRLIQMSYENGNNNFTLNTQDSEIDLLAYKLKGREDNRLVLNINGSVGKYFGQKTKYVGANISANVGNNFGKHTVNSIFQIEGSFLGQLGHRARNSEFYLNKTENNASDVDIYSCGFFSKDCVFDIKGKCGSSCGSHSTNAIFTIGKFTENNEDLFQYFSFQSKDGVYQTYSKDVYQKIANNILPSNTARLLGPNGEVLKEEKK